MMSASKNKTANIPADTEPDFQDQQVFFEHCLLNNYQRDFPLTDKPFASIAADLLVSPETVINTMEDLQTRGVISRIGAVFKPNSINASMLAAMAVPENRLEEVAAIVNGYVEVNHNYEREHFFNLWFVLHAVDEDHIHATLDELEEQTGLTALRLPIVDDFHIDLGFDLPWKQ